MNILRSDRFGGRVSLSMLALLVLGAFLAVSAASPRTAFGASYVVDMTSDGSLTACTGAANDCTLRGAMTNAAANGPADTITFDATKFPIGTPTTILLTLGALPDLSNSGDTIDATGTSAGVQGPSVDPCFTISGSGNTIVGIRTVVSCATSFLITGSGNTIGGDNLSESVCVSTGDQDSDGYHNDGCPQVGGEPEVGTQCNNTFDDDTGGSDGSVNDGCPPRGQGTVIRGGTEEGILVSGEAADGNMIKGNWIGLDEALGSASPNGLGVQIEGGADSNFIGGTTAGTRNVISGNTNQGVVITGSGTTGNLVKGDYIGVDASGLLDLGNGSDGVRIASSATGNTVGGMAAGDRNVISGNAGHGVSITGSGSTGNTVAGNFIGTAANGTTPVGNTNVGVSVASPSNTIGGLASTPGTPPGNVIADNDHGVAITGEDADGNMVQGNLIGTNASGTGPLGNTDVGVWILSGADSNVVGGSSTTARNVISDNGRGVAVFDGGTTLNEVRGNYIGTDITGTADLGNNHGITLAYGSLTTTVGGTTAAQRNVISGNNEGIVIGEAATPATATIRGNYIGTDASGSASLGNTNNGIHLQYPTSGSTVGGTAAGEGNTIAHNGQDGIHIVTGSGNAIRGNSIHSNGQLGIDLFSAGDTGSGVTVNDPYPDGDTGPNGLQNFPVITSASYNGINTTVGGHGGSPGTFADGTYTIDVYANAAADSSGNGEGQAYLGSTSFVTAAGTGTWSLSFAGLPAYPILSATATDASGSTSEFSAVFQTDLDGDLISSATDNCPLAYNPYQMDHDADGIGDVCDSVVRNRLSTSSSSLIGEYTSAPGEEIPSDTQLFQPFDYNAGPTVDIGSIVGDLDFSFVVSIGNTPCYFGVQHDNQTLYNASINNSPGNLVTTANLLTNSNGDPNLVDAIEKYPSFLNTYLDQERLTGIDNDGDTLVDEDAAGGKTIIDGDIDMNVDAAITAADDGRYLVAPIIDGRIDWNGDGTVDASDDGTISNVNIIDGRVDVNNSGTITAADDGDPWAGVNNDGDTDVNGAQKIDEDTAGSPPTLHARYFGTYAGSSFFQILVVEIVPNTLYRTVTVFNDPTIAMFPTVESCAPLEFRSTVNTSNADNPATGTVEGGDAVLGTQSTGTHVTKLEVMQPPDKDGDGVVNYRDNCNTTANASQADADSDGIGDACEPASGSCFSNAVLDCDGDGAYNQTDNCPTVSNNQADSEKRTPLPFGAYLQGDAIGDACDVNPTLIDGIDELAVSRLSDADCITGTGVTDADGDGWCTDGAYTTIGVGGNPFAVAVNPVTNRIYVGNSLDDTVSVIDGATNTEIDTDGSGGNGLTRIAVGDSPAAIAVNSATNTVYVGNSSGNSVTVINGGTHAVVTTIGMGTPVNGVAVNAATNRIYLTLPNTDQVSVIDGFTNTEIDTDGNSGNGVTRITVGSAPGGLAIDPVTNRIYVANQFSNSVSVIADSSNTVIATVPVGTNPVRVGIHPQTKRAYVNNVSDDTVSVINTVTNAVTATVTVGDTPNSVAVNTTTNRIYVENFISNTVSVIDGATNAVSSISVGGSPSGVAVNAVTGTVYVANQGPDDVSIIGQGMDPNDGAASVTPERTGAFGSCTNGVDDDGTGGTDSADAHCSDADGDGVADAADVCPQAADPLQLDSDGDSQGDACEDSQIAELALTAASNSAASDVRRRLVEVAPDPIHRSAGITNFIDPDWNIVSGSLVADGAIRASLASMITVGIDTTPGQPSATWRPCNNVVPVNYTLVDASTNPADTITSGGDGFPNLVADTDADGLLNGAEQYPSFLLSLRDASSRVDNDSDAARDEDLPDGIDNDQDGAVDEDPLDHIAPLVRMFADSGTFYGTHHVFNILIYDKGTLPNYATSDGYIAFLIDDDPTTVAADGNLTDVCSHEDHRLVEYGISVDNPAVAGNQGNTKLMFNDAAAVTEFFLTQVTQRPDVDGDGIENGLDVCVYDPDNDDDGTSDNVDPTPWNPRVVAPFGDGDLDGLPKGCDPNDAVPSPPGFATQRRVLTFDTDGDGRADADDNCPVDTNGDQTDSDADFIGDRCDNNPAVHDSGQQTITTSGTPVCTGGINADGDNFCGGAPGVGVDPDDSQFSNTVFVPEAAAIYPPACSDTLDNDDDTAIDGADTGCGDFDIDGVLNHLDNCPGRPPATGDVANDNPDQADNDGDGITSTNTLLSQPFARSAADAPEGDPSTVLGTPFARSDRFGGDVCDPDDDNDGLPDDNEPNFICPADPPDPPKLASKTMDGDCDNDMLLDLWEYNKEPCLSITVAPANIAITDSDGDGLMNYAEGVLGTDPCVANSGQNFTQDYDGDGWMSSHERYIIQQATTVVPQAYKDPCGLGSTVNPSMGWPGDFVSGASGTDQIKLGDLTSFLAPIRYLDKSPLAPNPPPGASSIYSRRWDLVPGPSVITSPWIQLNDLTALIAGTTGLPPMFGGTTKAFNGPTCTAPPLP